MWNRPEDPEHLSGDDGLTHFAFGERVPKTHSRIVVIGDLEELACHVGLLKYETPSADVIRLLETIDFKLQSIIDELRNPEMHRIMDHDVEKLDAILEGELQVREDMLGPYVMGEGPQDALKFRLAGTICRRAERNVCRVKNFSQDVAAVNEHSLQYLNRLSDVLFVLSR